MELNDIAANIKTPLKLHAGLSLEFESTEDQRTNRSYANLMGADFEKPHALSPLTSIKIRQFAL